MGRPFDCGCCVSGVQPSSVCNVSSAYFDTTWNLIENINSSFQTCAASVIELDSTQHNAEILSISYNHSNVNNVKFNWWKEACYGYDWWLTFWNSNSINYSGIKFWPDLYSYPLFEEYIPCSPQYQYEFIIKKQCYFDSGVYINTRIHSSTNVANCALIINDGNKNKIAELSYSLEPLTVNEDIYFSCIGDNFKTQGFYRTKTSGCFELIASGSSNIPGYYNYDVASSGRIDFIIVPSSNNPEVFHKMITNNCNQNINLWYPTCSGFHFFEHGPTNTWCFNDCASCCCDCPASPSCRTEIHYHEWAGRRLCDFSCSEVVSANNCIGGSCGSETIGACCVPLPGGGSYCINTTCCECIELDGFFSIGFYCDRNPVFDCNDSPPFTND
jgi:hypothetical protein